MAKTIIHPSNHLSLALDQIMKAAQTPRNLFFFLTNIIYHIHELRCPTGDPEEEEAGLITRDNDHLYSATLLLEQVAYPWLETGGTSPTQEMIEGLQSMLTYFGTDGWHTMTTAFTMAICRDLNQGPSSMKSYVETLGLLSAFCSCTAELRIHEEQSQLTLKAA